MNLAAELVLIGCCLAVSYVEEPQFLGITNGNIEVMNVIDLLASELLLIWS